MNEPARITIFVPLARRDATVLRRSGTISEPVAAYAPTAAMVAAHDYTPAEDEDAAYTAQVYARVAGLAGGAGEPPGDDRQLVVVAADVAADAVTELADGRDYGAVEVASLAWGDVTAVFVDDPDAAPAVRVAAEELAKPAASSDATHARTLDGWLTVPAVHRLITEHEQLWHHPGEAW